MSAVNHPIHGQGVVTNYSRTTVTVLFGNKSIDLIKGQANLTDTNGNELFSKKPFQSTKKSRGDKRREKDAKAVQVFNSKPAIEQWKESLTWINKSIQGNRNTPRYQMWIALVGKLDIAAMNQSNTFISDVCKSVDKSMRVSEKQAYILAKFAQDNNIEQD